MIFNCVVIILGTILGTSLASYACLTVEKYRNAARPTGRTGFI
jgi:ABC-type lipoprotein release transport system permease subunit